MKQKLLDCALETGFRAYAYEKNRNKSHNFYYLLPKTINKALNDFFQKLEFVNLANDTCQTKNINYQLRKWTFQGL